MMSKKNIRGGRGIVYTVVAGIGRSLSARVNLNRKTQNKPLLSAAENNRSFSIHSHCFIFINLLADRSGGTAPVTRAMILSLYEKKPKLDAIMIKIINYKEYKTLNI